MSGMGPARGPAGREVLRVEWLPGSDVLRGLCHCGAAHLAEGPVEVWEWLLSHPAGHSPGPAPDRPGAVPGGALDRPTAVPGGARERR
ncbi:hypothetical protein MF672_031375 [Actinomadura sp. ATCC 31491]|uniref:Uncharacterized protein n=1 Tax=Actinomadura luzonensis TaxID=2805427 RepID=A0ABT0G100_9ACTN|nr:hypothetical protein [Actinomadura luzonensis]MCK2218258.1 hypothetical protein [Actinomadura luzonensis]